MVQETAEGEWHTNYNRCSSVQVEMEVELVPVFDCRRMARNGLGHLEGSRSDPKTDDRVRFHLFVFQRNANNLRNSRICKGQAFTGGCIGFALLPRHQSS